jgi:hypothetical protein
VLETRFIVWLMSRILIADDQNGVLEALRNLLKGIFRALG